MFPEQFINNLINTLGIEEAQRLLSALDSEPTVSIRINPIKRVDFEKYSELVFTESSGISSIYGRFLAKRPSFVLDPLFHAGAYYVQEASSMAIESILPLIREISDNQDEPIRVLDLCAAPGGKTTHLLSILKDFPGSFLVSNEVIRQRVTVLAENVAKWGVANSIVTNNDPADFAVLSHYFDLILVDAPCSGEGMFRKDPLSRSEWSEDNVKLCVSRQRRILSDIWKSLKCGGLLVYSTCTFNHYENEDNVEWMVNSLSAELLSSKHYYPGSEGCGEGFYMAVLRKEGSERNYPSQIKNKKTSELYRKCGIIPYRASLPFVRDNYALFTKGNLLKAYPADACDEMVRIESLLKSVRSGVGVAQLKGDICVPECELALSEVINIDAFYSVNIDKNEALKFLSREPLNFDDAPIGYLLLKYGGLPIGFVKNIGNRTNNLWPNSWRIRLSR